MQQTPDQLFLTDEQLSNWARGLYAQAMDRDPIDAANEADVLAQALAARMVAICLQESIPPTIDNFLNSRTTSFWLITALLLGRQADPFQASAEAQALAVALAARAGRSAALPYSQAMEALRPHMLQSVLKNGN